MIRNLVLTAAGLALAVVGFGQLAMAGDDCCDTCDTCKKTCIPTIEKKKVEKKCFEVKCGTVCYPKCCSHSCGTCDDGCCDACPTNAKCGHPWKTHDLYVRVRTHEECVVKCTACETCDTCKKPCYSCGSGPVIQAAPPAKAAEPIAAPMPK